MIKIDKIDNKFYNKLIDAAFLAGTAYKKEDRIEEVIRAKFSDFDLKILDHKMLKLRVLILRKKKQVKIVIRGTSNLKNWIETNFKFKKVDFDAANEKEKIHKGFDIASCELWFLIQKYINKDDELEFYGHSLGSAIGDILKTTAYIEGYNVKEAWLFGTPKVGNYHYCKTSNDQDVLTIRVLNDLDLIFNAPPFFFGYSSLNLAIYIKSDGELILYPNRLKVHSMRLTKLLRENKFEGLLELAEDHDMKNYLIILKKLKNTIK